MCTPFTGAEYCRTERSIWPYGTAAGW